ncbi:MAG: MFS transporter, partial [Solirubrobacterales bacterium]|nr:MFS transporter [Solirubrobacterales bacterium]
MTGGHSPLPRGPFSARYPAAAAMVVFALVPYLALSAALQPLTPIIARQLHTSLQTMSMGSGLANAGYAVGTVLAVQLAQHLPQRRMMVLYAVALVVGSVLTAAASSPEMFIAGRVLQGVCTSLLLIAAVPPLVLAFGLERLRETAVIMSVCIFGAVALGPTLGGIQASADAWRPLFWIVALISLAAFVLSILTFEDSPPMDRSAPWSPGVLAVAAVGCVAAFYGSSQLLTHRFLELITVVPLVGGLGLIVMVIRHQYRAKRPLLTIRSMLSSTIPVAALTLALLAAAASVSATDLTASLLAHRYTPLHLGLLFLPELAGAVI